MKLINPFNKIFMSIDPSPIDNNGIAIIIDNEIHIDKTNQTKILSWIKWFEWKYDQRIDKLFIEDYENRNDINQFSNNKINEFIGEIKATCKDWEIEFKKIKAATHKFLFRNCPKKKEKIQKLKKYVIISLDEEKKLNNHTIDALSLLIWGINNE